MSNFPKTDYANAKKQVHEQAWQEYLRTQRPVAKDTNKTKSKIGRAINKLLYGH